MKDARTHYPRKAKEAQIKKQASKRAQTESIEFNFSSDDDYSPAVTPTPVPDFAHPYFVAIEAINSTINDMQSGNGIHELLLKSIAKTQREKLITAKEHAHSEADKTVIQELIDRINRTLLQPSPLTPDNLWNFSVPSTDSPQHAEEKEGKLKRAKTDSTDSLDNRVVANPIVPEKIVITKINPKQADFSVHETKLADPEIELTAKKITVKKSSHAKHMAALGIHKEKGKKREENPNMGDAQSARQDSLGLRKKLRVNYRETRISSRPFRK